MPDVVGDPWGNNKDFHFQLFLTVAAKRRATVRNRRGKVSLSR
jgi:hypothetical protein